MISFHMLLLDAFVTAFRSSPENTTPFWTVPRSTLSGVLLRPVIRDRHERQFLTHRILRRSGSLNFRMSRALHTFKNLGPHSAPSPVSRGKSEELSVVAVACSSIWEALTFDHRAATPGTVGGENTRYTCAGCSVNASGFESRSTPMQ